ncbi:hypothetical protein OKW21_002019 [Catalinimonas alkaloidigena]|nr:hypothetical protein [Catalinimonas alkaloidigena]
MQYAKNEAKLQMIINYINEMWPNLLKLELIYSLVGTFMQDW